MASALFAVLAFAVPARAVEPGEMLANPALETRAREISADLRCLVCQNESIDDSHADLAHDIRMLVRERLKDGDTNAQVKDYLVARYGQFILLRPPLEWQTLLLWGTPIVVLAFGGVGIAMAARRRSAAADTTPPLDEGERAKLDRILGQS